MPTVPITSDSITLGQFLKLAGLIEHGGAAKALLSQGLVHVNGTVEVRRGRKLAVGDHIVVGDEAQDDDRWIVGGPED